MMKLGRLVRIRVKLHFSPSMRSVTISSSNGLIDFKKIKVAARHILT
ncbi:hypothetical protein Hanom_Chr07g00619991 [Helianthus anomalus]